MKISALALAIIAILMLTIEPVAQKKSTPSIQSKTATASSIEPRRTLSGVMWETRITIGQSDWINPVRELYEYRLASARIVDGHLEFVGSFREVGKDKADVVVARLIATSARSANPWPGATSSTARERRPRTQSAQQERPGGEVNEQTQSLYSAANTGSGCELVYLKMQPPNSRLPLQVGVVLAHQDNEMGNQINQALCRVIRTMNAGENTDDALGKLNQRISRE
jgi:hypothetical protein